MEYMKSIYTIIILKLNFVHSKFNLNSSHIPYKKLLSHINTFNIDRNTL